MPICPCGFDFVRAALDDVEVESYAAIPDRDYEAIIVREVATMNESDRSKKLEMYAEAATRIGSIQVCPNCGILRFSKPGSDEELWLRPMDVSR